MQIPVCLTTVPYNRGIPEIILNRMEQQGQGTGCTDWIGYIFCQACPNDKKIIKDGGS